MISNALLLIATFSTSMLPATVADDPPQVLIYMRLLQVNTTGAVEVPLLADIPVLGSLFGKGADATATPSNDPGEPVLRPIDGSLNMAVAARDWELRVGEIVLNVRGDEITAVAGVEEGVKVWEILTAPRLLVAVGQFAKVSVGQTIPFMVQRDDGSLVVERDEEVFEGVHFSVLIDRAEDQSVSIKEFRVKIGKLVGRVVIEGVPFEVGRPIIQNTEASMSLRLKPDQTAVITLPRDDKEQPPIFMMLKARVIKTDL